MITEEIQAKLDDIWHKSDPDQRAPYREAFALGQASMQPLTSVFEIVDATDDEQYFVCDMFLTLEAAIAALDECKDPDEIGDNGCYEEYFKAEIRERRIGWGSIGKMVYERHWEQTYDEAKDEYGWKIKELTK